MNNTAVGNFKEVDVVPRVKYYRETKQGKDFKSIHRIKQQIGTDDLWESNLGRVMRPEATFQWMQECKGEEDLENRQHGQEVSM